MDVRLPRELNHFVQCFRAGVKPRQTLRDGVIDNSIVDAGYRAMSSGRWEQIGLPDGFEPSPQHH